MLCGGLQTGNTTCITPSSLFMTLAEFKGHQGEGTRIVNHGYQSAKAVLCSVRKKRKKKEINWVPEFPKEVNMDF